VRSRPSPRSIRLKEAARYRHTARHSSVVVAKHPLPEEQRRKIALFTNVEERAGHLCNRCRRYLQDSAVVPRTGAGMTSFVDKLRLEVPPTDLAEWRQVVSAKANPDGQVGPSRWSASTCRSATSYLSLHEALMHGGLKSRTRVNIHYIESHGHRAAWHSCSRRHGTRFWCPVASANAESKGRFRLCATRREQGVPYLGNLPRHAGWAIVEYGRHVLGLSDANSTEFNRVTPHPGQ